MPLQVKVSIPKAFREEYRLALSGLEYLEPSPLVEKAKEDLRDWFVEAVVTYHRVMQVFE